MVWVVVLCLRLINIAKKGRSQYGHRVTRKSCRIFCFGSIVSRVAKKKNRQISKGKKAEEKKRPDKNQKKGKWMQSVSLHHSPRNILGKKYTLVGYKEFPGTSSTYQAPGRVFADNLLAFRFLAVCFLYKTSPNPRKITCCGIWCALNATS